MPTFYYPTQRRGLPPQVPQRSSWLLRAEPVDDDGFRTTFRLSFVDADGELRAVGSVKILRQGMRTGRPAMDPSFPALGADYASLGAELEYYRNLKDIAGDEALEVLASLGDIALDEERRRRFEDEPGYETSLLRFSPARAALEEAAGLFRGVSPQPPRRDEADLVFHTNTGGAGFSVRFDLSADGEVPGRINVIVGANGSGKTRLLANLALAAFDPSDSPTGRSQWGTLEGKPSLSRVLAFSYSAFDDFDVPGANPNQKSAFLGDSASMGYRYFGLRNLSAVRSGQKRTPAPLKTARQIAGEFRRSTTTAIEEGPTLFIELLNLLLGEPSFGSTGVNPVRLTTPSDSGLRTRLDRLFAGSSTGHKFVLLMTAQLAAHVRPGSLVLVDEPEAHLHPPLLATFLKAVRHLLAERDSHAIIATHSPFVVQETPARYVRVVTRYVNRTEVDKPETETFGEDIGTVSREVFRLDSRRGEFVAVLQDLANRYPLEALEELFDNGLSSQARALVVAMQARRGVRQ